MQNQNTKPNAELLWKQLDDVLAPHLHLSVVDRAVYFHLVRHSRLEGNRTVRFSILKVARNLYLSHGPVRESVRRLVEQGVLRLIERTKTGHLVEPRLPEENSQPSRQRHGLPPSPGQHGPPVQPRETEFS